MLSLAESVSDYFNFNAVAWPAWDGAGHLVPPPDEHVLDALARSYSLVDDEESSVRPAANTVGVLIELPPCDLCGSADARVDGGMTTRDGVHASMCASCYRRHGVGTFGASGDGYLLTFAEVSDEVRHVCDQITTRLGRPSIFPR